MAFSTLVWALVQSKACAGAAMSVRMAIRLAAVFMGFFFPKCLIGGETVNAAGGHGLGLERNAREMAVLHERQAGGARRRAVAELRGEHPLMGTQLREEAEEHLVGGEGTIDDDVV